MPEGSRIQNPCPGDPQQEGHTRKSFLKTCKKAGFARVRVDGEVRDIEEGIKLSRYAIHNIEVVVDRLVVRHHTEDDEARAFESRLTDSIETALKMGEGLVIVNDVTDSEHPTDTLYSEHLACINGHGSIPEIEPRTFSFNTPSGACPDCQGLGFTLQIDPRAVVPNEETQH
jgi:excinuclease ABC subunit A